MGTHKKDDLSLKMLTQHTPHSFKSTQIHLFSLHSYSAPSSSTVYSLLLESFGTVAAVCFLLQSVSLMYTNIAQSTSQFFKLHEMFRKLIGLLYVLYAHHLCALVFIQDMRLISKAQMHCGNSLSSTHALSWSIVYSHPPPGFLNPFV